jgi:hypothetical protein
VTTSDVSGSFLTFDNLSVSPNTYVQPPTYTLFDFDDNAIDNGDDVTETEDGIIVTVSSVESSNINLIQGGSFGGSSGQVVYSAEKINSLTVTFSDVVNVNSLIAIDVSGTSVDYTFSTSGNPDVVVSLSGGTAPGPVDLNWANVTSFTITSSAISRIGLDDLNVDASGGTMSINDDLMSQKVKVYPNPVENVVFVKNVTGLKSITIYNSLGQQILQTKWDQIDLSHLSKGMYILKTHTDLGIETKRIIKK